MPKNHDLKIENLPIEILVEIFSYLSPQSKYACLHTCRTFCSVINSITFLPEKLEKIKKLRVYQRLQFNEDLERLKENIRPLEYLTLFFEERNRLLSGSFKSIRLPLALSTYFGFLWLGLEFFSLNPSYSLPAVAFYAFVFLVLCIQICLPCFYILRDVKQAIARMKSEKRLSDQQIQQFKNILNKYQLIFDYKHSCFLIDNKLHLKFGKSLDSASKSFWSLRKYKLAGAWEAADSFALDHPTNRYLDGELDKVLVKIFASFTTTLKNYGLLDLSLLPDKSEDEIISSSFSNINNINY